LQHSEGDGSCFQDKHSAGCINDSAPNKQDREMNKMGDISAE
jgi:hypothetical protein